ncbi:MAG: prepilin-type N-terminal cleavage/methylation domain-containing protein [Planctomycetes bacterium]|nr:prepilin-type N-terminal cleavage/methylation domain-containing protein [Planctomycetota bacterium]
MRRQLRRAFTLVEILVVISILGLLAGVLVVAIPSVFSENRDRVAQTEITLVKSSVDSFYRDLQTYPPNTFAEVARVFKSNAMMTDNNINSPAESLMFCLRTTGANGPYFNEQEVLSDGKLVNTDNDKKTQNVSNVPGEAIPFEMADPWGNPYLYLNLKQVSARSFVFQKADGSRITVEGKKLLEALEDKETGRQRAQGFALWSIGENGINEYGEGDDIASWR